MLPILLQADGVLLETFSSLEAVLSAAHLREAVLKPSGPPLLLSLPLLLLFAAVAAGVSGFGGAAGVGSGLCSSTAAPAGCEASQWP